MTAKNWGTPLVSIIVPVYNVERYIRRTVETLLAQDYEALEIILVDDGSPDGSPAILDEVAERDRRVSVVHKANGGVSSARAAGIAVASGEWLMFVDGDDWVDKDYVSYFVSLMEGTGCEVGMDRNFHTVGGSPSSGEKYKVSAEKAAEWIYLGEIDVAVWNKIYNAEFLRVSSVSFNREIWYGEGMLFNIELLQHVGEVAVGERAVYHQTFNLGSAMRSFKLENQYCGIRSLELQRSAWRWSDPAVERAWVYHRYCFSRSIIVGLVRTGAVEDNRTLYDECVRNLRKGIAMPLGVPIGAKAKLGWLAWFASPSLMGRKDARKYRRAAKQWQ